MIKEKVKRVAFVYEGIKSEHEIFQNIQENFFSKNTEISIICFPADGNLYMLWSRLKKDEFETNVIDILKEMNVGLEENLKDFASDDFSEIYMFFDYDGHNDNIPKKYYGEDVIKSMLETFDNETEYGKLYISYPMVEALKDISVKKQEYRTFFLEIQDAGDYKDIVGRNLDFQNFRKITGDMWESACKASVKQAGLIVNGTQQCTYTQFLYDLSQINIYKNQQEKFIRRNKVMIILNSIPLFLLEYFDESFWKQIFKDAV